MDIVKTQHALDEAISKEVNEGLLKGYMFGVLKDGKEILFSKAGKISDSQGDISRETIFRIFSVTKVFTMISLSFLLDEGLLSLSDPVEKYIPAFKNATYMDEENGLHHTSRLLTISDLVDMRSGLSYADPRCFNGKVVTDLFAEIAKRRGTKNAMTLEEFASRVGSSPLAFDPGSHWRYGVSADIVGRIIEVVSGKSFRDFMMERIFKPLNMVDTDFYVPLNKKNRLMPVYSPNKEGVLEPDYSEYLGTSPYGEMQPFYSGGAGLFSTFNDLVKFAKAFDPSSGFIKQSTIDLLSLKNEPYDSNLLDYALWNPLKGTNYRHLVRVMKDDSLEETFVKNGEFGWDGWVGAYFKINPNSRMAYVGLTSKINYGTGPLTKYIRKNIV